MGTPVVQYVDSFSGDIASINFVDNSTVAASSVDGGISFIDIGISEENDALVSAFNANFTSVSNFHVKDQTDGSRVLYAITDIGEMFVWDVMSMLQYT
jgi:hypothetical protein